MTLPWISTSEAAGIMGLTVDTVIRLRRFGSGPPAYKHGSKIRYLLPEVKKYAREIAARSDKYGSQIR